VNGPHSGPYSAEALIIVAFRFRGCDGDVNRRNGCGKTDGENVHFRNLLFHDSFSCW